MADETSRQPTQAFTEQGSQTSRAGWPADQAKQKRSAADEPRAAAHGKDDGAQEDDLAGGPRPKKARRGRPHPLRAIAARKDVIGRILIVLLALVACIIPVIFVNDIIGYIPLVVLVLIILISFIYLRILVRGFSFSEESLLPSCERGSDIDFVVNFKNATPLVFVRLEVTLYISDLFGEADVAIPATMPLMPFEERDFSFDARFDHVGTYSAGVKQIKIYDLIGLFSHTIDNKCRHKVEVLPRLFDVSRVDLTNVASTESNKAFRALVSDDMDYAGVRSYQWGDPLKTIHWNLSARNTNREYYTRMFETHTNPGLTIILDTSSDNHDTETLMFLFDGLLESALSVNDYARRQGVDSEIVYFTRKREERHAHIVSMEAVPALVSNINRIDIGDGMQAFEILRRETNSLHGQDNVAYCTTHLTEPVINALIDLRLHKRNPILFLVVPRGLEDEERRQYLRPLHRLDALGVTYYALTTAKDLEGGN